jgi:hypothetical protein
MIAVAGRSSRTSFGPCQVGSAIRADEFSDATLKMKQVPFSILDLISSAAFVQTQTSQTIQTKWIENEARAQRTSPTANTWRSWFRTDRVFLRAAFDCKPAM